MGWKRKLQGGLLGFVGFMLSPLSWWNDLLVNVPLAVGFAWLVSLFWPPAFGLAAILGYWLTNVLGLVLMQKGAQRAFADLNGKPYGWPSLRRDLLVSLLYTLLIVLLLRLKVLQPVNHYFHGD